MSPEEQIATLEANLRSVTDQVGRLMDQISGKGLEPVFRCSHSGLFLPADYVKEWGRKYGIGLGHSPVSEVLDSDYDTDPPELTNRTRRIEQVMHPVGPCMAQMDFLLVMPGQSFAVLDLEDPAMETRAIIVREKQLKNPKSRLPLMRAALEAR